MKQILLGHYNLAAIAGTFYVAPGAGSGSSTENNTSFIIPVAGTLRNLYVDLSSAPGGSVSRIITVRVNGVNTAIATTITGANTSGNDLSDSVAVVAGDRVTIESSSSGGTPAGSTNTSMSLEFEPSTDQRYVILGAGNAPSTSARNYAPTRGSMLGFGGTLLYRIQNVLPHSATIRAFYVRLTVAPGAGRSFTISIYKNGSDEVSSQVVISDAATTGSVTGLNIALSQGNAIAISSLPSGTPAATLVQWGVLIEPAVNGESVIFVDQNGNLTNNSTNYLKLNDFASSMTSTEVAAQFMVRPTVGDMKKLYVAVETSPGAGNDWAFNLRKGGVTQLTASIADAATSDDDPGSFATADTDLISFQVVPTSLPTSTSLRASFVHFIAPPSGTTVKDPIGVGIVPFSR